MTRLRAVSLFSSKICKDERKTSKCACNYVREVRTAMPRAFRATSGLGHRRSHFILTDLLVLRCSPRIFEERRDCSQST